MNKEELLGFLLDDSGDGQKKCVADEQAYSNWLKNDNEEHVAHEESPSQITVAGAVAGAVAASNKKKQTEAAQEDVEELLNGLEGIIGGADARSFKPKSKSKTKKTRSKPREENVSTEEHEEHIIVLEVEDVSNVSAHDNVNGASPSPNLDCSKKKEKRRKNAKELSYDELKDKLEITIRKSRLESKDLKKKVHRLEKRNVELEQRLEELKIENQTLIEINNRLSKNANEDEDITKSPRNKEKDRKRRERRTARRKEERKQEKKKVPQSFPSSTDMDGQPIEF